MKVTFIGAGSWGCALANVLATNNHQVLMYDSDTKTVDDINFLHQNKKVEGAILDEKIKATTSIKDALSFCEIVVISVPTKVMRLVLSEIKENLHEPKIFVNTSKGLEPDTFKRVSEIVKEIIPSHLILGFVALTGPTHAEEVIIKLPTAIVAVSENETYAKIIQKTFNNSEFFRVYTGSDLTGAELCGAIKNVYAIASGMLEGLGYGDNAKAALISRALVELRRLVIALGAKEETVFGLTGVGDLIVTTTSHHSRNYQAGLSLARGKSLSETISSMSMVVEGARTSLAAYEAAKKYNIETPIINEVYNVIYLQKPVKDAIYDLLKRKLKSE